MPRALKSGLSSLLLMAGLAFVATTSTTTTYNTNNNNPFFSSTPTNKPTTTGVLETINPWLSAADLQSTVSASSSCSAGAASGCPPPCSAALMPTITTTSSNSNNRSTQCLYYLQESHKEEVCGLRYDVAPERRRGVLHGLRMRHCCEHAVDAALPEAAFHGGPVCKRFLEALIQVDDLARRLSCSHHDLLTRYDCAQNYSIAHNCKDCKEAYRRWVCSSLVPHYTRAGRRVRPCLSVCEDVEQQCPYLLPDQTILPGEAAHPTPQYAGEPTFLCLDPNIPEIGEQRVKSFRGDADCCYTHCGTPGRGAPPRHIEGGGRGGSAALGVCEHCPGRPPNFEATSGATRTLSHSVNKVSVLLWTAWWFAPFFCTDTDEYRLIYKALRCLLVMYEYGARTITISLFLRDRRHSCS